MGRLKRFIGGFLAFFVLFSFSGCSTLSWVVNPPPKATDLMYTEEDVMSVISALEEKGPGDPEAVVFDGERYLLKPSVYKRALRDGIIRRVQEQKVGEFIGDYRRETFFGALKKDLGTAGFVVLIVVVLGIFLF